MLFRRPRERPASVPVEQWSVRWVLNPETGVQFPAGMPGDSRQSTVSGEGRGPGSAWSPKPCSGVQLLGDPPGDGSVTAAHLPWPPLARTPGRRLTVIRLVSGRSRFDSGPSSGYASVAQRQSSQKKRSTTPCPATGRRRIVTFIRGGSPGSNPGPRHHSIVDVVDVHSFQRGQEVRHPAVNRGIAGSIPAAGAI